MFVVVGLAKEEGKYYVSEPFEKREDAEMQCSAMTTQKKGFYAPIPKNQRRVTSVRFMVAEIGSLDATIQAKLVRWNALFEQKKE